MLNGTWVEHDSCSCILLSHVVLQSMFHDFQNMTGTWIANAGNTNGRWIEHATCIHHTAGPEVRAQGSRGTQPQQLENPHQIELLAWQNHTCVLHWRAVADAADHLRLKQLCGARALAVLPPGVTNVHRNNLSITHKVWQALIHYKVTHVTSGNTTQVTWKSQYFLVAFVLARPMSLY